MRQALLFAFALGATGLLGLHPSTAAETPPQAASPLKRADFVLTPEVLFPHTSAEWFSGSATIELASGEILLAAPWCNMVPRKDPGALPMLYVSRDRARTFAEKGRVNGKLAQPGTIAFGGGTLRRLQDGRLAFAMHRSAQQGGALPVISFSADEGATWTEPVLIGAPQDEGVWYVMNDRLIQLAGGRIVVPVSKGGGQYEGDNNTAWCYWSDDGAKTWSRSTRPARLDGERGMQEPCVVELSDGRLYMLARTGKGSHHKAHSSDGGATWSAPQPTTLVAACSPLTLRRLPDGRLIVVYLHARPLRPEAYFPRRPLVYALSADEGETWSEPIVIDDEPDRIFGYPCLAFLKEGILLVYDSELESEQIKVGDFGAPPDAWKYGGGKRCLLKYPGTRSRRRTQDGVHAIRRPRFVLGGQAEMVSGRRDEAG